MQRSVHISCVHLGACTHQIHVQIYRENIVSILEGSSCGFPANSLSQGKHCLAAITVDQLLTLTELEAHSRPSLASGFFHSITCKLLPGSSFQVVCFHSYLGPCTIMPPRIHAPVDGHWADSCFGRL